MNKIELGSVEETLFVPLRGRIYATKNFNHILNDKKAMEIASKIPEKYMNNEAESEYTLLSSAIRSMNMDQKIKEFIKKNPQASIINIGCGLETTFYRIYSKETKFYELDLKEVTDLRNELMETQENDIILPYSMFDDEWINQVLETSTGPYLVISSGVFYYFKEEEIIDFIENLKKLGHVELIFDAVSKFGMTQSNRYMKQLGKEDAKMYFYVDKTEDLISKISNKVEIIEVMDFFNKIHDKSQFKLITKLKMIISDKFHMVKMIHLKI